MTAVINALSCTTEAEDPSSSEDTGDTSLGSAANVEPPAAEPDLGSKDEGDGVGLVAQCRIHLRDKRLQDYWKRLTNSREEAKCAPEISWGPPHPDWGLLSFVIPKEGGQRDTENRQTEKEKPKR